MINIKSMITRYGELKSDGKTKYVRCQGCGEEITKADAADVEFVNTKRGSHLFIHKSCLENVWNHGIV